ncbi:hypothetical protein [Streptococcus porcinus]
MISYEKVRQSLKTLNILIIVLNAILVVFSVFGLISLLLILNNDQLISQMSADQAATLEQAVTPFSLFISIIAIALMTAIIIYTVINQSKIKKLLEVNYLPYYLGFGLCAVNIISTLLTAPNIIGIIIQLLFLTLYYFAFKKAKTLNEKEHSETIEDI